MKVVMTDWIVFISFKEKHNGKPETKTLVQDYCLLASCSLHRGVILFNALKISVTNTESKCQEWKPCPYQMESQE